VRHGFTTDIDPERRRSTVYAEPVNALSPELFSLWEDLHDSAGGQTGPFLHPAYVRAAGAVRRDVEVGIITRENEVVGFLPFQRSLLGVGGPVGSRLCDMAGALVRPNADWDPLTFASAAGLRTLRLPNVPAAMAAFDPFQGEAGVAPVLDLADGFDAYRQASLDSGSSFMRQLERKGRKLERDLGPRRFVWHTTADSVFDTLLSWKAAQRRVTRTPNVLRLRWARALIERLRLTNDEGFAGVLSALYVGDTLAAAHFGIRTRHVLHYWIPAYNNELSKYSPGLLALMDLADAAADRGIRRIDLGSGEERYKLRAATGAQDMRLATVNTSATFRALTTMLDHTRSWSHGSRLGHAMRRTGRSMIRGSYLLQSALASSAVTRGRASIRASAQRLRRPSRPVRDSRMG
jgi:CelD/BcsL family acetyltransferase involved in cellulose biosynthesis